MALILMSKEKTKGGGLNSISSTSPPDRRDNALAGFSTEGSISDVKVRIK